MFINDLIICITSDASLNSLANGGIRFDHLPTDFNSKKSWIVFDYELEDTIQTLDDNSFAEYYNVTVQIVSKNMMDTINIFDRLSIYLNSYDDGKIRAITQLPGDPRDYDTEKGVYYKNANFSVLYTD